MNDPDLAVTTAAEDGGEPELPESRSDLRLPVSVLMVGGLLLVVMSQSIYALVYVGYRLLLLVLIGIGLASFTLASYLITRQKSPPGLANAGRFLMRLFGVSAGQIVLLFLAPCFALLAALAAGESLLALNLPVSLGAWLLAIFAALAGSARPYRRSKIDIDRRELLVVVVLFLIAFMLRAISIDTIPSTLSGDEGSSGLMAIRFLNGEANNLLTVGWFSFPSLYFALQSLGILVLDQTAAGLRITSALAGALTVVAVYWLARTLFGRVTAVLAALFLASFHYHIHFSRIGLNNIWDGLFAIAALAGLAHGWKSGRRSSFLISGLAVGLGQYFYVSIRILPLLMLLWAGLAFLVDRATFKRRFADLILTGYVAFVVALPLNFFFQQHPDEFNAPLQRVTIFDGWLDQMVQQEGEPALAIIGGQILDTALGFTHLPIRHWYNPGSPLLLPAAAGLFLLGLLWTLTHINLNSWLVLLPLLSVVLLGAFSQDAPASQRYILAAPMVAILLVLPLSVTAGWLWNAWPRYRRLVLLAVATIMIWIVAKDLNYYFSEVYDNYVLGGHNTEVATAVAHYLDEMEPSPDVYFFGFPRMGYYSLSTIPFLAPDVSAEDVLEPLVAKPSWTLDRTTVFIFLPERTNELQFVRDAYPGGDVGSVANSEGTDLFHTYEVSSP